MRPTVVDDSDRWGDLLDAAVTFVDNVKDSRNGPPHNFWAGKSGAQVKFIFDLGCYAKITEVHLRNSYNGQYMDRQNHLNNKNIMHFLLMGKFTVARRILSSVWPTHPRDRGLQLLMGHSEILNPPFRVVFRRRSKSSDCLSLCMGSLFSTNASLGTAMVVRCIISR